METEGLSQGKKSTGQASSEEEDQIERSTKKVKATDILDNGRESWVAMDAEVASTELCEERRKTSYLNILKGNSEEAPVGNIDEDSMVSLDDSDSKDDEGEEDCPNIRVSKSERSRLWRPWKQVVIIKLLGKRVGFKFLERKLHQLWNINSLMVLTDIRNDFYIAKFSNGDEYDTTLFGGPWVITDHYFLVREWCPNFDPDEATIDRVAVWVRLPNLPIEYYDRSFLTRLGNRIGRTIRVDDTTVDATKGKFARICMDVDLSKPLISKYRLKRQIRKIEYEAVHLICFECGLYGHRAEQCPKKLAEMGEMEDEGGMDPNKLNEEGTILEERPEIFESYGPWMLVQRKNRGKSKGAEGKEMTQGYEKGSRFKVLEEKEKDEVEGTNSEVRKVIPNGTQPEAGENSEKGQMAIVGKEKRKNRANGQQLIHSRLSEKGEATILLTKCQYTIKQLKKEVPLKLQCLETKPMRWQPEKSAGMIGLRV